MIRALQEKDEPALLELLQRSLRFEALTAPLLREKVHEDPGTSLVWDEGRLLGFCHGVPRGSIKLIAVDPEHRRRGIGSELLQAVERSLCARKLRAIESVPNYLLPGLDVRYTEAILFFEKHGYQKFGECYNLCCELAGRDFARPAPEGFEVRRATPEDRPVVMELLQQHFAPWQAEVEVMMGNHPISLHLAFSGPELLGFAGYDANNRGTGWFGPMGTNPEHRGAGLGGVLLARCLQDFQAQGLERCTIPWVGPFRFYARACGAFIERVFWRYEKSLG